MLRHALLGMIAKDGQHGYDLKNAFEQLLGGTWPLNIGQVYSTLARLERDGLVESRVVPQALLPDRKVYRLTPTGRQELDKWLEQPSEGTIRLKDEFFVKLLVHQLTGSDRSAALIQKQRQVYMHTLGNLTALLERPSLGSSTALLIQGAILHVEADLNWLDLCERKLKESAP